MKYAANGQTREELIERIQSVRKNPKPRITAVIQARILQSLLDGGTFHEIMEETGISKVTLTSYLRALHKPADGLNLIHVHSWEEDKKGARTIRIFKWGPGLKDAKKPVYTNAERQHRKRLRDRDRAILLKPPVKGTFPSHGVRT